MVLLLVVNRNLPKVETLNMAIISLYSLTTISISLPFAVAVTMSALSSAQCILVTSGITSGLLIFRLTLNEKITIRKDICVILCLTGVILIVQPEFLFYMKQVGNTREPILSESGLQVENGVIDNGTENRSENSILCLVFYYQ